MLPVHKQTLLRNTSMEGKYFTFSLQRKNVNKCLANLVKVIQLNVIKQLLLEILSLIKKILDTI